MNSIKQISEYLTLNDSEVIAIQSEEPSLGIWKGWVIYSYQGIVYEMTFMQCLYYIYKNKTIQELIELSEIFKDELKN